MNNNSVHEGNDSSDEDIVNASFNNNNNKQNNHTNESEDSRDKNTNNQENCHKPYVYQHYCKNDRLPINQKKQLFNLHSKGIINNSGETSEYSRSITKSAIHSSKSFERTEENKNKWLNKYKNYIKTSQLNEGVIKLSIIDAPHFSKKVYTPFISICNLPFRLSAKTECSKRTNNQKYFSLYVDCYPDSESCLWSCLAEVEIRIKASNLNDNDIVKCFQHDYTYKTNNMGYPSFVEWEKLIDETNSFLHEGTLTIEATIKIINIFGIREKITYDFTQSESLTSDVKLNIDGINIYVNKDYLSLLSPVFKTMFYSSFVESNMKEVCLQQINIDDFIELLEVIYPSHKEINDKNVGVLLELGDRFEISYVMEKCEKFLMDNDKISFASKLVWSDTYRLPKLQDACLSTFKSASDLKTFRYSDEYRNISDATKVALYEKFFKLF